MSSKRLVSTRTKRLDLLKRTKRLTLAIRNVSPRLTYSTSACNSHLRYHPRHRLVPQTFETRSHSTTALPMLRARQSYAKSRRSRGQDPLRSLPRSLTHRCLQICFNTATCRSVQDSPHLSCLRSQRPACLLQISSKSTTRYLKCCRPPYLQ